MLFLSIRGLQYAPCTPTWSWTATKDRSKTEAATDGGDETDNDGWEYSTAKHVDDPRERPHWKAEAFTRARVRRRVWYQVAVDPDVFGGEGAPSAKYGATVPIERLIA